MYTYFYFAYIVFIFYDIISKFFILPIILIQLILNIKILKLDFLTRF